eukprot:CAMPEP_0205946180 /NCGR_PEP_ID=MMETSP1325-20131115/68443_1 /ASSEMBLY_ACC=CAM_ASM_000708 /TAXON_ID=236786 /ORGANISM="Florenciella sp., Strain RCC1007" /LENGTH=122 /DNA_ID=CAMNT_0053317227 /DNA_START=78 /DNA_END=443 /DNA_ORIENTATION=-
MSICFSFGSFCEGPSGIVSSPLTAFTFLRESRRTFAPTCLARGWWCGLGIRRLIVLPAPKIEASMRCGSFLNLSFAFCANRLAFFCLATVVRVAGDPFRVISPSNGTEPAREHDTRTLPLLP